MSKFDKKPKGPNKKKKKTNQKFVKASKSRGVTKKDGFNKKFDNLFKEPEEGEVEEKVKGKAEKVEKVEKVDGEKQEVVEESVVSTKRSRFILFIGNLNYDCPKEELKSYFEKAGPVKEVRFLMKDGKPRGCAFVEFTTSAGMLKALLFHHTTFNNRKINVEMTCGGGGNGKNRKKKLEEKKKKTGQLIDRMSKFQKAKAAKLKQSGTTTE